MGTIKTKIYVTFIAVLGCTSWVVAQSAGSKIWYFGLNAGVSFMTNPPSALTNGSLSTDEGCAAVSDQNGKLFFYTDGRTVYNRNHATMTNGSGLNGDPSSTQSAVAVGDPANPNKYYLFTVDAFAGTKGLCYSVIDMAGSGGLGSVTTKNTLLRTPVSEKITAIRRANSSGVWIVTRGWNNDSFHVFLLDSFGCKFHKSQSIGTTITGGTSNTVGYLKSNIQGTKVAYATYMGFVELFDFDALGATFSNTIKFSGLANPYGVEFSKSGNLLYFGTSSSKKIWQADVSLSTPAAVLASLAAVVTITGNAAFALQMGPDEKIYIAIPSSDYISSIPYPEVKGTGCGYIQKAVDLNGKLGRAGLPNALNSDLFLPYTQFTWKAQCTEKAVNFDDTLDYKHDSIRWYFGVKGSSYLGMSNQKNPSFVFPKSDSFDVKLVAFIKKVRVDSITKKIWIPKPVVDTVYVKICSSDSIKINNVYVNTAGIYADTFNSYKGCDSVLRYILSINKVSKFILKIGICPGETFNFYGTFLSTPGTYYHTLKNYLNCDSLVQLELAALQSGIRQYSDSFCYEMNYQFNGQTLTQGGIYEAHLLNYLGCDSLVRLNLYKKPKKGFTYTDTFCFRDTFIFYDKQITQPGKYSKIFASNASCDSTITLNLIMKLCYPVLPCILEFPEAFTPDGNAINDVFKAVVSCNVTEYELYIFNRWGEIIFKSQDPKQGWDGMTNGKLAPQGIYAYRVNLTALQSLESEKKYFEGIFTILR